MYKNRLTIPKGLSESVIQRMTKRTNNGRTLHRKRFRKISTAWLSSHEYHLRTSQHETENAKDTNPTINREWGVPVPLLAPAMTECVFTYCTGQLSCGLHCDSQLNNPILMIMWLLNQRFLVVKMRPPLRMLNIICRNRSGHIHHKIEDTNPTINRGWIVPVPLVARVCRVTLLQINYHEFGRKDRIVIRDKQYISVVICDMYSNDY
jgi:hypothetical protein